MPDPRKIDACGAAVPVAKAARELDVSRATLRRWLRHGAPQLRRGRRGRGGGALLDVGAIRAWRSGTPNTDGNLARILASELPNLLADAAWQAFCAATGPHKVPCAPVLAHAWYLAASATRDRLAQVVAVPEISVLPKSIVKLRQMAHE